MLFRSVTPVTVTIAASTSARSLVMDGFAGTLAGASPLSITGSNTGINTGTSLWLPANISYSGLITLSGTGGYIINPSNAVTLSGAITFNSTTGGSRYIYQSGTVSPVPDGDLKSNSTITLTGGSIVLNNITTSILTSSGSTAKTIVVNGGIVTLNGTGTVLSLNTTVSISSYFQIFITDTSATAKTISQSGTGNYPDLTLQGNGTGQYNVAGNYSILYCSNTGGATLSFSGATTIQGDLDFNFGNMVLNSAANTVTFNGSSSIVLTITTSVIATPPITITNGGYLSLLGAGGKTFTGNITITGGDSSSFYSGDNQTFTTTGTVTLTNGSVSFYDCYIANLTITNNALYRNFSVSNLYLTGSGTLASVAGATGLSIVASSIYVTGNQSLARTLTFGTVFYPTSGYCELAGTGSGSITLAVGTTGNPRVYVTNTGGAVVSFSTGNMAELIFTGGTNVVWTNAASQTLTIDGDLTLVSTMGTPTLTPSFIFKALGWALNYNSRITSAGKTFITGTFTLTDASWGSGNGNFTFVDAFNTNSAVTITSCATTNINANFTLSLLTNTLTHTLGTLTVNNGANITCGLFSSSNSNTRTINMGWGTWNLTGTGTVWSMTTSTNATLNCQQSKILMNNTASLTTPVNFAGGGLTYYTVEYARGAATATNQITGSNTYVNFIDNTSTAAHTISFASGSTHTYYKFNVRGSAGALITIGRSSTTVVNHIKVGQGIVCYCDYIVGGGTTSPATPANTWYIGANSSGSGGGWNAGNAPSSQSLLGAGGVG